MPEPANKGRRYPAEILSAEEVGELLRAASPRAPTGLRARALIALLYRGGLRVSEALALYPKDVDERAGTVTVLPDTEVSIDGDGAVIRRGVAQVDPGDFEIASCSNPERAGATGLDPVAPGASPTNQRDQLPGPSRIGEAVADEEGGA